MKTKNETINRLALRIEYLQGDNRELQLLVQDLKKCIDTYQRCQYKTLKMLHQHDIVFDADFNELDKK